MKKTIKDLVTENREIALAAKTPAEIKAFIEGIGCATKQRWTKAVAAIIEIGGVDYYAARGEIRAATAEALRQSVTHQVALFVDAKARCQRFGICDESGQVLWHGIFFEDDQSFSYGDRNEQSACECAAGRKAIWLASKIKEAGGAKAIRLILNVDAQWLCSLAGKASILASDARRLNVDLVMNWIRGTTNPADEWTTAGGFKKWNDNDLAALAYAIPGSISEPEANDVSQPAEQTAPIVPPAPEKSAAETAGAANQDEEIRLFKLRIELERNTGRLGRRLRFGCEKFITTFHQFDGCIATINRTREALGLPHLNQAEVLAFKALQNFSNEAAKDKELAGNLSMLEGI